MSHPLFVFFLLVLKMSSSMLVMTIKRVVAAVTIMMVIMSMMMSVCLHFSVITSLGRLRIRKPVADTGAARTTAVEGSTTARCNVG